MSNVDDNPGIYGAISTFVGHINSHERPVEEFRAGMIFILTMLKIDPDDINQALCQAYSDFEDNVVVPRREQAEAMLEQLQGSKRGQG